MKSHITLAVWAGATLGCFLHSFDDYLPFVVGASRGERLRTIFVLLIYAVDADNIKYDEWTDEIIPKNKIETYNNDNKYITKSNGDKVYFADIKQQLTAYEELQGDYAFIKADNVDKCKSICDVLFLSYFELSYSIDKISDGNSYLIHLKDFTANGMHYDDYSIGPTYEMRSIIKYLVKGIYREQNGLEADYGY